MIHILEVKQVNQVFRTGFWLKPVQILHGVDLSVPRGSIFGFLGANGAGKTTLIHLIAGLRSPRSGTVTISGLPVASREARAKIGYLPERPYFHEHLTGEGLLRYFGALSGMSSRDISRRVPEVLRAVGMEHARGRELKRYSKGMLQRIGIAQSIIHDPELLVLDEPMSGLDPVGRKEMRELILKLAGEGKTVFFSSHVIPDVEAICDEIAVIEKGRIVSQGPVSGFLQGESHLVEVVFGGIAEATARELGDFRSLRTIAEGFKATLEGGDRLSPALARLIGAGARILTVNPIRPSLESFFEGRQT